MSKKREPGALATRLPSGRKRIHGGYTYLMTGRLPEHRRYIEAHLTAARAAMIQERGPTEEDLSVAQIVLIDRAIAKIGCLRCMEEHVAETGVMQGKRLAPVLRESYLAYSNSLRLDLQALGIDKKRTNEIVDLGKYIEQKDEEKAKATGKAGDQAQAGQVNRQGGDGDVQDKGPETGAVVDPGSTSSDIPGQAGPGTREGQD